MMMWLVPAVGLTGMLCGCFFRAPALVFLSFLSFASAFVLAVVVDWTLARAVIAAVLLTGVLQFGYLFGAGLCYLLQNSRSRSDGRVNIGSMRRASH
jgi:hypothetical protein